MDEEQAREVPGVRKDATNWRACCVAPAAAAVAIFLLTTVAALFGPKGTIRQPAPGRTTPRGSPQQREAFTGFGCRYFEIARKADGGDERAFAQLQTITHEGGSLELARSAFVDAGQANRIAAREYRTMEIPGVLASREKLRDAADTMSEAYDLRTRACETIVRWIGEPGNQALSAEYGRQAQQIDRLTVQGLRALADAGHDNGVTIEDISKFLPAAGICRPGQTDPFTAPGTSTSRASRGRGR